MTRRSLFASAVLSVPLCAGPLAGDPLQPEEVKKAEKAAPDVRSIAEEPRIHLRGAAWFSSLDGMLNVGNPIPGATSDIDLIDTLNLTPDKTVIMGSATFDLGKEQRFHITLGYSGHFKYDGTSDPVNISFNNLNYTGVISSSAKFDIYEVGLLYDWARPGPVTISVGTGTRIFSFKGSVSGTATDPSTGLTQTRTSSADATAPIPGLSAALRWDITDQIYIRGSGAGIYLGHYGNFFDTEAEVGFDITANIGVFGGYRWMHAEADVSDVNFDLNLKGFFAGAELRF